MYVVSIKSIPKDLKSKKINFIKRNKRLDLSNIDIFINCSPLGSNLNQKYLNKSPIIEEDIKLAKKNLFVFDAVYNPQQTLLSKICIKSKVKYENGIKMNTIQAQLALKEINKYYNSNYK